MQYIAPKIIHTKGFVKIRYRTTFMLMGIMCLYYYEMNSYLTLTTYISDVISPSTKTLLERQDTVPHVYIGIAASLVPELLAGRLSEMFSSKWIMFTAVLILATCFCLIPLAVNKLENIIYLDLINAVIKFAYGIVPPAAQVMITRWGPPKERFLMGSLIYSSLPLGKSLAVFITTFVSVTIGWEYTFYFSAGMNFIWLFAWVWWIRDDPSEHEQIGEEEKEYIMKSLKDELYQHRRRLESRAPWREILRSAPVWAALITNIQFFLANFIFSDQFDSHTIHFRTHNVMHPLNQAVVLTMPYIWLSVITWFFGLIFYNLILNGMTKARVYRVGISIFLLGSGCNAILFYYSEKMTSYSRKITSILLLSKAGYLSTIAMIFTDIAPNYAGTLAGFCSTIARSPILILGLLKERNKNLHRAIITCCNIGAIILSALISLFYCTGELEPWNNHCHLLAADDLYLDYDI